MKYSTTLFLAIISPIVVQAQPILQSSDMSSSGISMQMYTVLNAGSSNPAPDGAGITWDFTSAQMQLVGTVFMGDPNTTPFASLYPTANWSITQDFLGIQQRYSYFRYTETVLQLLADNVPQDANVFTDPRDVLRFPFEFMDSFSDTYQLEGGSPATVSWDYSAYGTILSTFGTDDVVKTVSNENEIVFWKQTPLHPFIIINPSGILVFSSDPIGIQEAPAEVRPSLYPNPVNDLLHLADVTPGMHYALHDALGRIVLEGSIRITGNNIIPVDHLAPGRYHVRLWNSDRSLVLPLIKE